MAVMATDTANPPICTDESLRALNSAICDEKESKLENFLIEYEASQNPGLRVTHTYNIPCAGKKQITGYYCGVASAQQVIYANGNTVPSTYVSNLYGYPLPNYTGSHPQVTLSYYMRSGGVTSGGASSEEIATACNHYTTGTGDFYWGARHIDTVSDLENRLLSTIAGEGKCCVVWIDTRDMGRYSYQGGGHYITVNGLTTQTDIPNSTYLLCTDPHYDSRYFGSFNSLISDICTAMQTSSSTATNLVW